MSKKNDSLINHFEISDDEISLLMDELTRFSPSEAEVFFAETRQASPRSERTSKKSAASSVSGESRYPAQEKTSVFYSSASAQSRQPSASGIPSNPIPDSVPLHKTDKKKHGFIWGLIALAIIVFAVPRISRNKPEPLPPEVTQPVMEEVVFPESRTEPMMAILRSDYYSQITEERLEALGSFLKCKSISLENGDLILDPAHDREAMKTRLQQFFQSDLETRIGQPGCPHFTNAEVNADYTVIKITVNDVNMSADERKLADDILLYSTVYSGLSGKDNAEARIDFDNMLGQTVRTMNNS